VAAFTFWMAGLGAPLGVTSSVAYGALALIASLPGGAVLLARRLSRTRPQLAATPESDLVPTPRTRPRHRLAPVAALPAWSPGPAEHSEAS
jgi:hypothetical protein